MRRTRMPTSDGFEKSEEKTTAVGDAASESTKGILKFLSPSQSEWQELNPIIAEDAEDRENQKRQAKEARETLKETLLAALQMPNLMVFAGSGTSLSSEIGGPSMLDL